MGAGLSAALFGGLGGARRAAAGEELSSAPPPTVPGAPAPALPSPPEGGGAAEPGALPEGAGAAEPRAPPAPGAAAEVPPGPAPPAAAEAPRNGPDEQEKSEQPLFSLERFRENLEALRAEEADAERKVGDVVQEERGLFKKGKGRIRELQDMREQLAETELKLMQQQVELDRSEQSVEVLLEELELERKLRGLLTKEKEKAVEEASLALGLCSQGTLLP